MKFLLYPLIIFIFAALFFSSPGRKDFQSTKDPSPRSGTAIIMTGAAARIPQEAALLEELDRRGLLNDVVFISGVSSGSLNAVMLNGILSKKMSWGAYKDILFSIRNEDIFTQEGKKIPLNTAPARALYKRIAEDTLGYHSIGDLPYCTAISFTHPEDIYLKKVVHRMCSRLINQECDTSLSLVDIMMASSAIPIVFPAVRISNVKTIPDVAYVDGGIGEDHIPYRALLEFEKFRGVGVEKVYIISRKTDSIPEVSEELKAIGVNDFGIFDKLHISLESMLSKGIEKRLRAYASDAPELVPLTYIWIPDYSANFLLFDFENLKEQYDLTSQWARTSNPIPLKKYLDKIE